MNEREKLNARELLDAHVRFFERADPMTSQFEVAGVGFEFFLNEQRPLTNFSKLI